MLHSVSGSKPDFHSIPAVHWTLSGAARWRPDGAVGSLPGYSFPLLSTMLVDRLQEESVDGTPPDA